jgi:uncharacterized protein YacL
VTLYSLFVVFIIGAGLGIMIGFLFWILAAGLEGYTIVWSVVFLVFTALMFVLFYIGGKSRIKEEKRLIIEQQQKEEKMRNKDNRRRTYELER